MRHRSDKLLQKPKIVSQEHFQLALQKRINFKHRIMKWALLAYLTQFLFHYLHQISQSFLFPFSFQYFPETFFSFTIQNQISNNKKLRIVFILSLRHKPSFTIFFHKFWLIHHWTVLHQNWLIWSLWIPKTRPFQSWFRIIVSLQFPMQLLSLHLLKQISTLYYSLLTPFLLQ